MGKKLGKKIGQTSLGMIKTGKGKNNRSCKVCEDKKTTRPQKLGKEMKRNG